MTKLGEDNTRSIFVGTERGIGIACDDPLAMTSPDRLLAAMDASGEGFAELRKERGMADATREELRGMMAAQVAGSAFQISLIVAQDAHREATGQESETLMLQDLQEKTYARIESWLTALAIEHGFPNPYERNPSLPQQ